MTDDIVTRLRGHVDVGWIYDDVLSVRNIPICLQAADEIERLRIALRCMAVAYAENADLYMDEDHIDEMCFNYYQQAVRND